MLDPPQSALALSALGIAITLLSAIPSLVSVFKRLSGSKSGYKALQQLYEDEDGSATKESQDQFSQNVPRSVALVAVLIGFFAALAAAILVIIGVGQATLVESWLRAAAWGLLTVQALTLFIEPAITRRYTLGIYAAISCLTLAIVTLINNTALRSEHDLVTKELVALVATQFGLLAVSLLAFICIPRRPEVYDASNDLRPVDGERSVSFLSMISFTWQEALLKVTEKKKKKRLDYKDLPQLRSRIRAKLLTKRYDGAKKFDRLWKTVVVEFRQAFFVQTILIVLTSICEFLPQLGLLKLLQVLETRQGSTSMEAWLWVVLIGVASILISLIEGWMFFAIWSQLGIPLRSMMSTLIFEKAMRRKDVKGGKKESTGVSSDDSNQPIINPEAGPRGETTAVDVTDEGKENDGDGEEMEQKTRQGTINLIGVDSYRVASFCTYFYFYPGTIITLTISLVFLVKVIGWESMLAGLIAFTLTIPLNIWASSRYANEQDKIMTLRDKKLAVVTEALQGIRQIKFSALEDRWQEKISETRAKELAAIWRSFLYDTAIILCYILSPILLSGACLGTYALLFGELRPSVAFTTISVLSNIETSLAILPELTTEAIDAWVSIKRIEEYLNAPERVKCSEPAQGISFDKVDAAWPADGEPDEADRFVLKGINFEIPMQELTVVSGKTGSGKSLLLAAVLGEIDKLAGTIYAPEAPSLKDRFDANATKGNWIIDSAIAFVAQIPWIENATIRENILFGLPYDSGRYEKTIEVCALEQDLEMLDDGDSTEIGHNGVNLSGGQRWRVSFARAVYSRAGILVLDDIFSAVDAHVGRQLFEDALTGELAAGRTRILVTHHVSLVISKAKYSIHLANGTVSHAGFVEDLERDGTLQAVIRETEQNETNNPTNVNEGNEEDADGTVLTKVATSRSQASAIIDQGVIDTKATDQPKKFVEEEKREEGAIKFAVYKEYLRASGSFQLWIPVILGFAVASFIEVARNWWVSQWTSQNTDAIHANSKMSYHGTVTQAVLGSPNATATDKDQSQHDRTIYYLTIYLVMNLFLVVIDTAKLYVGMLSSMRASRVFFEKLVYTVLRTPLRWLDTVPVGRILNRFTGDFNVIDSEVQSHTRFFFYKVMDLIAITAISFYVSPIMAPLAAVLLTIATLIARRYLRAARPIKRLENNAKSPMYELFGSVLMGMPTVRAYNKAEEYITRMWARIDQHGRSYFHLWLMNRWMGFRLSIIGASFVFVVAIFIVATNIDASLAGFALSFSLGYSEAIIWVLRCYANFELDMTACERIQEYSRLDTETQTGTEPPAAWPSEGRLEVHDLVAGYALDLPPVLKGLSFAVDKGQRVGVVGRTGAGKSSLTLALFRFLEPRSGKVYIDGVDTATITLKSLRSRLAIIPQDPVLFSGTVRSNLDPFDQHEDSVLRDALARVHLTSNPSSSTRTGDTTEPATPTTANKNPFSSLSSPIAEGGLNLSQGQRQLLCLARAIVARPKLMILDEATSAVDKETDELIQRSIREEFVGSTLLVIAHRLSTIADFDKILVMGAGEALEYDTPRNLLEKKASDEAVFRGMVEQSGERDALEEIILGEKR